MTTVPSTSRVFNLKPLSRDAVPAALAKAERYRLLNEPGEAESICLDILQVDPANHDATVMLVLALTDQFPHDSSSEAVARAGELAAGLPDAVRAELLRRDHPRATAPRRSCSAIDTGRSRPRRRLAAGRDDVLRTRRSDAAGAQRRFAAALECVCPAADAPAGRRLPTCTSRSRCSSNDARAAVDRLRSDRRAHFRCAERTPGRLQCNA